MIKRLVLIFALLALPLVSAAPVSAACGSNFAEDFLLLEPWHSCLPKEDGSPAIHELNDIWKIVVVLLDDAVKLVGYIAVVFMIYGGVLFITSRGDPGKVANARTTILNAVIGLTIAVLAVAIIQLIAGTF